MPLPQDPSAGGQGAGCAILDSITEGVFTTGPDWRITSFNSAAEKATATPREHAIGQICKNVFRADICESECGMRETLRTGLPIIGRRATILDAQGNRRMIMVTTAVLKDERGEVIGGVETFRDLTAIESLRKQIRRDYRVDDIITCSHRMQRLLELIPDIADSTATVLIEGETGTGKELLARAIHNHSGRRRRPFVAVNSGALPDTLLESELFGYKAGAFTDARKDKPGRFARAEGGTLFLDEIGDISPALQVRLLRVLQERVYEPLGSVDPVKADVRIIAATNRSLRELMKEGRFREDLYYRINVLRLELPPLRERVEDIPFLVEHFIERLNSLQGKEVTGIAEDALACLMAHSYPGNIRELENLVERAFVLCRSGRLERRHLPAEVCWTPCVECPSEGGAPAWNQVEAAFLMSALRRNNWNRLETARELGIHKTTLFRKMRSLHLEAPRRENGRTEAAG